MCCNAKSHRCVLQAACCKLPVLPPTRTLSEGSASVFLIHVLSQHNDSSGKCIATEKGAVEAVEEINMFAGGARPSWLADWRHAGYYFFTK